ncbi:carbon monoxide dehydrogenase [Ureibacillus sp. GCM10028918]|uniref:carbon monoxide dehydrogenase n=1 Tax=Ureibacillus sp. GCM10028918 TaxID=3273429 RepID=UPI0036177646
MIKSLSIILLGISILFLESTDGEVWASVQQTNPYFEDHSRRVGYKTVDEAVKEFERNCNCEVKLPTVMPEIAFTHGFSAIYDDKKNGVNQVLQIRFVNRKLKSNNFKIEIRKDKLGMKGEEVTLQDGTKGIYSENHLFTYLVFEKNNLQYQVGLDKNLANPDTIKVLMEVADSIH